MFDDDSLEGLLSRMGRAETDPYLSEPECAQAISFVANPTNLLTFSPKIAGERELIEVRLGQYSLVEKIGEGGMGSVYRARHLHLQKTVAVKILSRQRGKCLQSHSQFRQEIISAGQLNHPNIVSATDAGEDRGIQFLVMEFVEGLDLGRIISHLGPLDVADACEVARQVAVALQYLDGKQMLHGDVKPSNIMVTPDGSVKLLDLGLTRGVSLDELSEGEQVEANIAGTLAFMAPEYGQSGTLPGITADLFSLGAAIVMLVTGRPLRQVRHLATESIRGFLAEEVVVPADVPVGLRPLLQKLLATNPAERIQTPEELIAELQSLTTGANLQGLISDASTQILHETSPLLSSHLPTILVRPSEAVVSAPMEQQPIPHRRWPLVAALTVIAGIIAVPVLIDQFRKPSPEITLPVEVTGEPSEPVGDGEEPEPFSTLIGRRIDRSALRDDRERLQAFLDENSPTQTVKLGICRLDDAQAVEVDSLVELPDAPFGLLALGTQAHPVHLSARQLDLLQGFPNLTFVYLDLPETTVAQLQAIGRAPRLQRLSLRTQSLPDDPSAWDELSSRSYFFDFVVDSRAKEPMVFGPSLLQQISRCRFLRSLNFFGAIRYETNGVNPLSKLPDLYDLNLTGDHLDTKFLAGIKQLSRVRTLTLISPALDSAALALLNDNHDLTSLTLGDSSNISDADLADLLPRFHQLQQLTLLRLSSVDGSFLSSLASHSQLYKLACRSCPLTPASVGQLTELKRLNRLELMNCGITRESLPVLEQLPSVKLLYLSENPLSSLDIAELRKSMPETIIYGAMLKQP